MLGGAVCWPWSLARGLAEAVSSLGGAPVLATDGDVTIEQLASAAQQTCGDVVILPNGSQNLKQAGEVATELRRSGRRVGIIPTRAQVQGLAAMGSAPSRRLISSRRWWQ